MRLSLAQTIKRLYRRISYRGVDFIYDHEVAALQALLMALPSPLRERFVAQFVRYDRIDRSPCMRKQQFVDDDSDFERSDWPAHILFGGQGVEHAADIVLHNKLDLGLGVKAQAFVVRGKFDGFEFKFSRASLPAPVSYPFEATPQAIEARQTVWLTESVTLFQPWGTAKSSYQSVPL